MTAIIIHSLLLFSTPEPSVIRKQFTLHLLGWFLHPEDTGQGMVVTPGCPSCKGLGGGWEGREGCESSAPRSLRRELS